MLTREAAKMLLARAREAREKSYSPYSRYAVGAALLTESGRIYTGANIESATHTPTVCAERVALQTAVHEGERAFAAIAIVGAPHGEEPCTPCAPCGVCRQVMAEFCKDDFAVVLAEGDEARVLTLAELLPHRFVL